MTPQQERDLRVLEYIYDNDNDVSGAADLPGLWALVGESEAARSASTLRDRGLIRDENSLSGGYHITGTGSAMVEEMHARRNDRGYRRGLCRDELLRWIDSNTTTDPGSRRSREDFDGGADLLAFTEEEVTAAAIYLAEQSMVESVSAAGAPHIAVWITDCGRECVDEGRGIRAFVEKDKVNVGGQIFHISGSGNTVAAAIGDKNEVTASISQFDPAIALQFAAAVRQAMPALNLPSNIEETLRDIEQQDDPSRAQRATAVLYTFLMGASTGTLGQVLGMVGASALGIGS